MINEEDLPDFTGKVVAVYLANASRGIQDGVILEYATFKNLGGRLFLVGRAPELEGMEWVSHLHGAIAWDSVQHYLIFDSGRSREFKAGELNFKKRSSFKSGERKSR